MSKRIVISVAVIMLLVSAFQPGAARAQAERGETAELNGIELYYEITGEGEPLVLLHGFMNSCRAWDPMAEKLAEKYMVVAVDLRGHGHSTNPGGDFTMRQSALDIYALLDLLGIDRFRGMGISAGAVTLLHMATQQPDRVEAMVLVGSGIYYNGPCREQLAETAGREYSEQWWEYYRRMHPGGDEQIRALLRNLGSFTESYDDLAFTPPHLATIAARTLFVHGDRDYCFPASMVEEMYTAVPNAYLWIIPNGGHVPIYGKWLEPFADNSIEFLGGAWEK